MTPLLRYVSVGWSAKRKDVMDGFTTGARQAYFEEFDRSCKSLSEDEASKKFEELYFKWYGRRFFLLPGLLLLLVSIVVVTLTVLTVLHTRGYLENPFFDVPDTGMAAIAGAYLWVTDDFISRSRRLDFSPSDVLWGVLRLIIAVPMGYAFAAVAAPSVGPFVAFALGAFPLTSLNSMLQRLANKNLVLVPTADESSDDIVKLQSINRAIAERFSNEDVTTIAQIAYCDPVDLVMRSSLTFNFVTDCMNQALAWMYIRDGLDAIRPLGLRGSVEIKHLIDAFDADANADPKLRADHDRAVLAFPKIAAALKQDTETLQITFREIAEDPYTIFLDRCWEST
jgi:hypothetical protein